MSKEAKTPSTLASSLTAIPGSRAAAFAVLVAVSVCALVPVVMGLRKSLWLDEAWVANSVMSASLQQVFYYDDWLQTSPPLFLLLAKWTVQLLGPANWAFRMVPFISYVSAATLWWALVSRLFSRWPARFAWVLFVLNATAVAYAGQMKPYCSDLAATTAVLLVFVVYLERPTKGRIWMLTALAGAGLLLSYPLILFIPAIVVAVWMRGGWRQSAPVAIVAAAVFVAEYRAFVAPNLSDNLKAYWFAASRSQGFAEAAFDSAYQLLEGLPVSMPLRARPNMLMGWVGVWLILSFWACGRRFRREGHRWGPVLIVCMISCLAALAANSLKLYPISHRTSLFLLPALLLLLAGGVELTFPMAAAAFGRMKIAPLWNLGMICATFAIAAVFVRGWWFLPLGQPVEDMQAAVSFLKRASKEGDALAVHANASEPFKLYSRIEHWKPRAVIAVGDTSGPCCRRSSSGNVAHGDAASISGDLDAKLSNHLPARLWLLYSSRTIQWQEDTDLQSARIYLVGRGCLEKPGASFTGVGILSFQCGGGGF